MVSAEWLGDTMTSKIKTINWPLAAQDLAPFLPAAEQLSLSLWSERFFADKVRFDVRILWLTFVKVLRRDGVSH